MPAGLAGGTFEQAAAALAAVQLGATRVEEFSDTVTAGKVIGRARGGEPGAARQRGRGPRLEGPRHRDRAERQRARTSTEAIARLEGAGLDGGRGVRSRQRASPFVTDPRRRREVKRGTTVDIYLRR